MDTKTTNLVTKQISNERVLDSIKVTDTVHSWLNMLNRVVDICNIVDYPEEDRYKRTYSNLFGFMTSADKKYLDGIKIGIIPTWNTIPPETFDEYGNRIVNPENLHVDASIRKLNVQHSVSKQAKAITINESNAESVGSIVINPDSMDVQCIDAYSNVQLEFAADSSDASNGFLYYAEKLISIKAKNDIHITYSANDAVKFVNNSIYPNVEWENAIPVGTFLLKGTFIVYKATFIHNRILLSVVENSQLLDNYKAASARHPNYHVNGDVVYDADISALRTLNGMLMLHNVDVNSTALYIARNGTISSTAPASEDALDYISSFKFNFIVGSDAKWESASIECRPVKDGRFLNSSASLLQDGRHMIELWSDSKEMVVKIEYVLNMFSKTMSVFGFTVFEMNVGRTYDE